MIYEMQNSNQADGEQLLVKEDALLFRKKKKIKSYHWVHEQFYVFPLVPKS